MKYKFYLIFLLPFILFACSTTNALAKTISFSYTFNNFKAVSTEFVKKSDNEQAWYFNLTGGNVSKTNILGIRPRLRGGQAASSYYIYKSLTQGAKRYYYKDTLDIHQNTEVSLHYKKDDRSTDTTPLTIYANFTP